MKCFEVSSKWSTFTCKHIRDCRHCVPAVTVLKCSESSFRAFVQSEHNQQSSCNALRITALTLATNTLICLGCGSLDQTVLVPNTAYSAFLSPFARALHHGLIEGFNRRHLLRQLALLKDKIKQTACSKDQGHGSCGKFNHLPNYTASRPTVQTWNWYWPSTETGSTTCNMALVSYTFSWK
jgi:hypothetical protein